jgi:hypothetical protein
LSIAPERADPVLVVRFDVFGKVIAVGKPRIEEVGVPVDTYLFFEFGDDLTGKIVLCIFVFVVLVLPFRRYVRRLALLEEGDVASAVRVKKAASRWSVTSPKRAKPLGL